MANSWILFTGNFHKDPSDDRFGRFCTVQHCAEHKITQTETGRQTTERVTRYSRHTHTLKNFKENA